MPGKTGHQEGSRRPERDRIGGEGRIVERVRNGIVTDPPVQLEAEPVPPEARVSSTA